MPVSVSHARKKFDSALIVMAFSGSLIYLQVQFLLNGFLIAPRWSELDGQHWLFAVITRLRGDGFANHLTMFSTKYSEIDGDLSLVGYPPVHLLATYLFAKTPDIFGVLFSIALIEGIALLLLGLLFSYVIKKNGESDSKTVIFGAFILLSLFSLLDFGGRPESTFVVFLIISLIYCVWSDWDGHPWILGLLLGLMGATAPTAALLVSSLVVALVGMKKRFGEGLWALGNIAVAAAATVLFLLELWYGILESLTAILEVLALQMFSYPSWMLFLKTNMLDWYRPFFGIVFATGVAIVVYYFRFLVPKSFLLFFFGITLFSFIGYQSFYSRPHCTYNLLALTPIFLLLILNALIKTRNARLLILAVLMLPLSGLVVQVAIYTDYQHRGLSLRAARDLVAEITRQIPQDVQIALDPSLWLLADSISNWSRAFFLTERTSSAKTSNAILIIKEGFGINYAGSLTSPPIVHLVDGDRAFEHVLIADCNRGDTMRLFGKEIYQPIFGYGFTVYAPTELAGVAKVAVKTQAEQCRPKGGFVNLEL